MFLVVEVIVTIPPLRAFGLIFYFGYLSLIWQHIVVANSINSVVVSIGFKFQPVLNNFILKHS